MTIHLVDDAGIQQAHLQFFSKNTTTDVISVRYDPFPGETGFSGEMIVNVQQATRARCAGGWNHNRELALYIAHGLDHLHGGRDDTPSLQQRMRRRELRWLRHLEHEGFDFASLHAKIS